MYLNHTAHLRQLALCLLLSLSLSRTGTAQAQPNRLPPTLHPAPVDLGLFYPLSTGGRATPTADTHFSLHLLEGISGGLSGFSLAGLLERIEQNAEGVLVAGIGNQIKGKANGTQIAGLFNLLGDSTRGTAIGGLLNRAGGLNGAQIAGLINTSGDIRGLQMAGLINKAKRVKGMQLSGLINLADSSDYPIGLINLIKNGDRGLVLSTDVQAHTLLGFQSGSRVFYGRLSLGYHISKPNAAYLLEAAFGAHLYRSNHVFQLNTELRQMMATDFIHGHSYTHSLRLLPAFKLGPRFQLFAGPELSLILDYSDQQLSKGTDYFWNSHGPSGHFIGGTWGAVAGLYLQL